MLLQIIRNKVDILKHCPFVFLLWHMLKNGSTKNAFEWRASFILIWFIITDVCIHAFISIASAFVSLLVSFQWGNWLSPPPPRDPWITSFWHSSANIRMKNKADSNTWKDCPIVTCLFICNVLRIRTINDTNIGWAFR